MLPLQIEVKGRIVDYMDKEQDNGDSDKEQGNEEANQEQDAEKA